MRGVYQCALRVYLDRFLNVPAARLPSTYHGPADLSALATCWDMEGKVDEAGGIVFRLLTTDAPEHPVDPAPVIAALGRQLLTEDAGFHWYQILEASIRQFAAWPAGSDQGALIMAGTARFLAAHTRRDASSPTSCTSRHDCDAASLSTRRRPNERTRHGRQAAEPAGPARSRLVGRAAAHLGPPEAAAALRRRQSSRRIWG